MAAVVAAIAEKGCNSGFKLVIAKNQKTVTNTNFILPWRFDFGKVGMKPYRLVIKQAGPSCRKLKLLLLKKFRWLTPKCSHMSVKFSQTFTIITWCLEEFLPWLLGTWHNYLRSDLIMCSCHLPGKNSTHCSWQSHNVNVMTWNFIMSSRIFGLASYQRIQKINWIKIRKCKICWSSLWNNSRHGDSRSRQRNKQHDLWLSTTQWYLWRSNNLIGNWHPKFWNPW